jgi:predicted PhzF superfamily epimerase YddE/YHI9
MIVTSFVHNPSISSDGYDVLSRFFAPWLGVPEDHVTGSAHSVLAPYWQARLQGIKDGRSMAARQCSPRGGDLLLRVDSVGNKVVVSGHAVIVIKGTFFL